MNQKIQRDTIWQCLALAIFTTCVVTACEEESHDELAVLSYSERDLDCYSCGSACTVTAQLLGEHLYCDLSSLCM